MKNLPEKDFWKDVGNRLGAYTEEPADDGWDNIARALLPQRPPRGFIWIDRFAGLTLLVYLSFMAGFSVGTKEPAEGKRIAGIEESAGEGTNSTGAVFQDQRSEEKQSAPAGQSAGEVPATDRSQDDMHTNAIPSQTSGNDKDRKARVRSVQEDATSAGQVQSNSRSTLSSSDRSSAGRQVSTSTQTRSSRTSARQSKTGSSDERSEDSDHNSVTDDHAVAGNGGDEENGNSVTDDHAVAGNEGGEENSVTGNHTVARNGDSKESGNGVTGKRDVGNVLQADNKLSEETWSSSSPDGSNVSETSDTQALKNNVPAASNPTADQSKSIDSVVVAEVPKVDSAANSVTEAKTPAKKKKKTYPQLYIVLSPSLSFQKLTPLQTDQINVKGMQSPGILSADRFGISFEAGFQRPIAKRFEMYAGLSYYHQKQTLTYEYLSDEMEVSSPTDGQYTVEPKILAKDFRYNMLNAGISAGAFYHIKGKKLMHKVGAGIQFQKGLLRAGSEDTYDNAGSSYLNYQVLYRVEYLLNRKVNIFVQPGFTHAFYAKEPLEEPFTIKPYRASLGFGMLYRF